jgi:hypothetical protein
MYISLFGLYFPSTILLKFLPLVSFSFSGILGCSSFGPSNIGLFGVPFNRVREEKGRKDLVFVLELSSNPMAIGPVV